MGSQWCRKYVFILILNYSGETGPSRRDSENFSAFESRNYHPLAIAGIDIKYFTEYIHYPSNKGIIKVNANFDEHVAILKFFPGMNQSVFNSIFEIPGLKGIVLESFGSGNVPTTPWLGRSLKESHKERYYYHKCFSMCWW